VTVCPSNSYLYQNTCSVCASSCVSCDLNGCLQCSPTYLRNAGVMIKNNLYYNCYSTCPTLLPYLINNTICSVCNDHCIVCNTTNCLQCDSGFYRYNIYCLSQCPPGYNISSGACVNLTNNSSGNSTNPTSVIASEFSVPIPFSIAESVLILIILISKLQHNQTLISLSILGVSCILAIVANVFYTISNLREMGSILYNIYIIFLLIGLAVNYINNLIFLFLWKYTLGKDEGFDHWHKGKLVLIKK